MSCPRTPSRPCSVRSSRCALSPRPTLPPRPERSSWRALPLLTRCGRPCVRCLSPDQHVPHCYLLFRTCFGHGPVAFELGCWFVGSLPTFLAWWIRVLALSSTNQACAWRGCQRFYFRMVRDTRFTPSLFCSGESQQRANRT